ncbi:unnamed protein product [Alternaria alternata]|uniref:Uncharacterized protein n=1 Tax=Alternaria alternata TaxID=5599 RepID=A0A4Q4N2W5_ALTAL|nr:hypothetical protein AA0117_g11489 [Alternaria alternata]RYN74656.1 hypothetical protein AA0120_g12311 [Alternaria tenuissima]
MAPATFSDLPPEMVSNVFAFVRQQADQGAICLVSRVWRDLMAPMMWEKLKMNLSTASPRSIATLLHPCSDILSHVRDLNIYGTKEGEDYLRLVIAAIPRDRVRTFWTHFSPETLTLHLLLLSQRKIEDLAIFRCFITSGHPRPSDLDSEEHHEWMGSSLPEVSSIHLGIGPNEASDEDAFYDMKFVSRCCPKMTCLSLFKNLGPASEGFLHSVSSVFKFSLAEEAPLFQNLTCLRLFDLDIATPEDQPLCKNFNLSKLRSLQIKECDYLIPFLEGLSSFYIDCTGQLDELIILLPEGLDQPLETIQAMERLLKNCPKLQSLDMDFEGTLHQVVMQNLANQIMRFMAKQGSNLKILSFKPVEVDEEFLGQKLVRDGNGHRWPEYHYCRGHATDITGTNVVIAHPSRNIALEFPGLAEFFD